ncbi:hypothetical protein BATDEDRAFT_85420 [Batrachochytrium dendrobatidis JAM81]|uniref:Cyclin N-terminal domain-containing protein n=2 Tax=Batrachochytrium dendrobatidis TaxID=109871 RepID=F4NVR3_BATDJ|nr:uncharacterized protein BATDEDRAFT_85420 [Batrachochytrium dendrobatidis JAM81]EGF84129.1 hypothetical protein BATDEDRAFT_85420 [Batrachochytrium dendrobatidis JAM81]OAJ36694.1 cyclin domain-containing protein [Batrachochytrium dendrobatidis JEL423]|eukprot:XP_006676340.1 hypothetical protein BATDEDRAFT_85420 [Batrachochytrium dendrobatidis JAM81]
MDDIDKRCNALSSEQQKVEREQQFKISDQSWTSSLPLYNSHLPSSMPKAIYGLKSSPKSTVSAPTSRIISSNAQPFQNSLQAPISQSQSISKLGTNRKISDHCLQYQQHGQYTRLQQQHMVSLSEHAQMGVPVNCQNQIDSNLVLESKDLYENIPFAIAPAATHFSHGDNTINYGSAHRNPAYKTGHGCYLEHDVLESSACEKLNSASTAVWLNEARPSFSSESIQKLNHDYSVAYDNPAENSRKQSWQNEAIKMNTDSTSLTIVSVADALEYKYSHVDPQPDAVQSSWVPICSTRPNEIRFLSESPDIQNTVIPKTLCRRAKLIQYASTFIDKLFGCGMTLPQNSNVELDQFIKVIISRTRLSSSTLVTAFLYLERLKTCHPKCKGSPGSAHRLILSAIMLAAKFLYDDTFDNTAWATVSSGIFSLEQVNHMEMEMLYFLDYNMYVSLEMWNAFYTRLETGMEQSKHASCVALPSTLPTVQSLLPSPVSRLLPGTHVSEYRDISPAGISAPSSNVCEGTDNVAADQSSLQKPSTGSFHDACKFRDPARASTTYIPSSSAKYIPPVRYAINKPTSLPVTEFAQKRVPLYKQQNKTLEIHFPTSSSRASEPVKCPQELSWNRQTSNSHVNKLQPVNIESIKVEPSIQPQQSHNNYYSAQDKTAIQHRLAHPVNAAAQTIKSRQISSRSVTHSVTNSYPAYNQFNPASRCIPNVQPLLPENQHYDCSYQFSNTQFGNETAPFTSFDSQVSNSYQPKQYQSRLSQPYVYTHNGPSQDSLHQPTNTNTLYQNIQGEKSTSFLKTADWIQQSFS